MAPGAFRPPKRSSPGRRGLDEPTRKKPGLVEQKKRDLRDVRAGSDVNQIILIPPVKRIGARPVMQGTVNVRQIPSVPPKMDLVPPHLSLRRYLADVRRHAFRQILKCSLMQQFQPVDQKILMLEKRNRRPPFLPALWGNTAVQRGSKDTDHYSLHG